MNTLNIYLFIYINTLGGGMRGTVKEIKRYKFPFTKINDSLVI